MRVATISHNEDFGLSIFCIYQYYSAPAALQWTLSVEWVIWVRLSLLIIRGTSMDQELLDGPCESMAPYVSSSAELSE